MYSHISSNHVLRMLTNISARLDALDATSNIDQHNQWKNVVMMESEEQFLQFEEKLAEETFRKKTVWVFMIGFKLINLMDHSLVYLNNRSHN